MTGRRIFRIVFVGIACLSLLLNAVLIGVGVRLAERGWLGGGVGRALAEMPRETRQIYAAGLRAERPTLAALNKELRSRRTEMLRIAAADPVDPVALAAAMENVRAATTSLQTGIHGAIMRVVEESSEPSSEDSSEDSSQTSPEAPSEDQAPRKE